MADSERSTAVLNRYRALVESDAPPSEWPFTWRTRAPQSKDAPPPYSTPPLHHHEKACLERSRRGVRPSSGIPL